MTRRGVISIHDYPEHLNPFREDEDEVHRKFTRKERGAPVPSPRHGTPSQSPVKPERPPLPNRTKIKDKENEVGRRDEDKYFRQGTKPKKKRPAPLPPSPNKPTLSPGVSDGSLDKATLPSPQKNPVVQENSPDKEEQRVAVPNDSESPEIEDNGTIAADPAVDPLANRRESPVNGTAAAAAPASEPDTAAKEDDEGPCDSERMAQDLPKEVPEAEDATELKEDEGATCNGKSEEIMKENGDATEEEVTDPRSSRKEDDRVGETDVATPEDTSATPMERKSEKTEEMICSDEVASKDVDPQPVANKPCDSEPPSKTTPLVDPKEEEMNGSLKAEEQMNVGGGVGDDGPADLSLASTGGTASAPQADDARNE